VRGYGVYRVPKTHSLGGPLCRPSGDTWKVGTCDVVFLVRRVCNSDAKGVYILVGFSDIYFPLAGPLMLAIGRAGF
jgi:hypothetical protein